MSYIDAMEMVAGLFRELRILVETGYRIGVVVYFIAVIMLVMYLHYDINDERWLYKD